MPDTIYQTVKSFLKIEKVSPREHLTGERRLVIRLLRNLETGEYVFDATDSIGLTDPNSGMQLPLRVDFAIPVETDENAANLVEAFEKYPAALQAKADEIGAAMKSAILIAGQQPPAAGGSPFDNPFG